MSLNSISLRYLSIYFALISLLMSMLVVAYHFLWNLPTPERLLFFTLPAHTCLAGISIYLAFKRRIASEKSVLFLMLTSMCLLAFFLYDTGGQTNPLISLMLLPLAMTMAHAHALRELPLHHRDPFDRMLISQARSDGLTLLTHDDVVTRYEVQHLLV